MSKNPQGLWISLGLALGAKLADQQDESGRGLAARSGFHQLQEVTTAVGGPSNRGQGPAAQ
ncbi:hypothetical protein ACIPC1_04795 [Streptomyces sp. NPDC087263]|uniref:hypothetical protein n=1 Tax=Streptomyces sp. NPDC087263 TaxID=3365773 RepID=UPI0038306D42